MATDSNIELSASPRLEDIKSWLQSKYDDIDNEFTQSHKAHVAVKQRAVVIDLVLNQLWHQNKLSDKACLIAVGGYGRQALHPQSDIDILILIDDNTDVEDPLSHFIQALWDLGLTVGHAVRTLSQCVMIAREDITVITNIDESRWLCGKKELFTQLKQLTHKNNIWPTDRFFEAKVAEQSSRYKRFAETSFNLEPNIKASPGGMRDLHLISWVANRHFDTDSFKELARKQVLTVREYRQLLKSEHQLSKIRYALHIVAKRPEERLLFEYQPQVAKLLGFKDNDKLLAVEQMMKQYFASVLLIRNLNSMLLDLFRELVLEDEVSSKATEINDYFQVRNNKIGIIAEDTFTKHPHTLVAIFSEMAKRSDIKRIQASTLRAIRENRDLINQDYRDNPKHKKIFLNIFKNRHISRTLVYLKRYGILAKFVPAFAQITGQMQFDMFHLYTVDEHTLFLLKNISMYYRPTHIEEHPLCSKFLLNYPKTEILYLAALYHDIAKGRGGDHSELGAIDAKVFCLELGLDEIDAKLVAWLVQSHLLMSMVAQRQDITDPEVIHKFASQVKTPEKLGLLYCLTVADIRATNTNLFNSWKDSLLRDLYLATKSALTRGLDNPLQRQEQILSSRNQAKILLNEKGLSDEKIQAWWQTLSEDYFLSFTPQQISWHAHNVIRHGDSQLPRVAIQNHPSQGGTEVMIYLPDEDYIFAAVTAMLSQKSLVIQRADIYTTSNGFCFDSFIVLEQDGSPVTSTSRLQSIKKLLQRSLKAVEKCSFSVKRRSQRQLQSFNIEPKVTYISHNDGYSQIQVEALDQPGLLAQIATAFVKAKVRLHGAKVVTLGEKAEDIFSITDRNNEPLTSGESQEKLRQTIIQTLNQGK